MEEAQNVDLEHWQVGQFQEGDLKSKLELADFEA